MYNEKKDETARLKDRDSVGTRANFSDDNPSLTIQANTSGVCKLPSSKGFDVVAILVEHSNATIVSHQDVVIRINKDVARIRDLASTHNPKKIALRIKDLQSIAAVLTHDNIPIRQKTYTNRTLQLPISCSI